MRNTTIKLMPTDVRARIAADQRGAITTGYFNGKHPVSLPYFYLNDYPEIAAVYGQKPETLFVMFPANDLREFIIAEHNLYLKSKKTGKGIKFRYCDGETCAFNMDMRIAGKSFSANDTSPCVCRSLDLKGDDACKSYFHFKAWILNPNTGLIVSHITYRFETRSTNSRDNILSELKNILLMTSPNGEALAEEDFIVSGKLVGIPFALTVKMIEQPAGKETKRFPIWSLRAATGDKNKLLQYAEHAQLPITRTTLALETGEVESSNARLLSTGASLDLLDEEHHIPGEPIIIDSGMESGKQELFTTPSKSYEREKLEHVFMDYAQDKTQSQISVAIGGNWSGDVGKLTEEQLRKAIAKWSKS